MNIKYDGTTATITIDGIDLADDAASIQNRIDGGGLTKDEGGMALDAAACRQAIQTIIEYRQSLNSGDVKARKAALQSQLDKLNEIKVESSGAAVLSDAPVADVAEVAKEDAAEVDK